MNNFVNHYIAAWIFTIKDMELDLGIIDRENGQADLNRYFVLLNNENDYTSPQPKDLYYEYHQENWHNVHQFC